MNELAHYITAGTLVVLPTIGVGIGQGLINRMALKVINEQPEADTALKRISLVSMALSETALLLAVVMSILLITDRPHYSLYSLAGIIGAVAIPGFLVGIASALPGKAALRAAARQPFFAPQIMQLLLITQAILQTPSIFGFIIGIFIRNQAASTIIAHNVKLFAAGLAFGLGSLGPIIGLGMFAHKALESVGFNRALYPSMRTFAFISQALIEAPIIFALVISLTLLGITRPNTLLTSVSYLAAALSIGLTTLGTGINSGKTAAAAAEQMGHNPQLYPTLSRLSFITQSFIDTTAIYGTLVALLLLLI